MITINPNNPEEVKEAFEKMKSSKAKLKSIVEPFLTEELSEKEILELCHLAKFIFAFDDKIKILEKRESPDFIIQNEGKTIGLEIERIFNLEEVQNIKSKQELFNKATKEFENKYQNLKLLANFWLHDGFMFKGIQKNVLIEEIVNFTYELVSGDNPQYPSYIEKVDVMKHSGVSFNFNEGVYMPKDLPVTNLIEAINKKEAKVTEYKDNTGIDYQWLLIVSGIGSESFNIENVEIPEEIESQFEHIYLLEDFDAKVTEIK